MGKIWARMERSRGFWPGWQALKRGDCEDRRDAGRADGRIDRRRLWRPALRPRPRSGPVGAQAETRRRGDRRDPAGCALARCLAEMPPPGRRSARDLRDHHLWTDEHEHLPARFVFVTSLEGKARLAQSLKAKNIDKMMGATGRRDHLVDDLDPPAASRCSASSTPRTERPHLRGQAGRTRRRTASRNGTLQAPIHGRRTRARGLDVGATVGVFKRGRGRGVFRWDECSGPELPGGNLGYADETVPSQKPGRGPRSNEVCCLH